MPKQSRMKLFCLVGLSAIVLCSWAGAAELGEHLIAKWTFDEGGGPVAKDGSGNGHDGALRSLVPDKPPARVEGMVGKAMKFNAENGTEILVKNHDRLNPGSGLTIAAWIKYEGRMNYAEIVGKKGIAKTIVDGYRLSLARNGRIFWGTGDGKVVTNSRTERHTIQPGAWYHVAATFAPGHMRIYVNGKLLVDDEVEAQQIAPSRTVLMIGNFAGRRNALPFNGLIDEVYLFDTALEAADIFKLAQPDKLQQ